MLAKDKEQTGVIRMVLSRITEKKTSKGFSGEMTDNIIVDVIAAYKKSLEKARGEYDLSSDKGKAAVAEMDYEIAFCKEYLPTQMGEAEVKAEVDKAVAELGKDPKLAGRITGAVMKANKGKVEAALVKKCVAEALA